MKLSSLNTINKINQDSDMVDFFKILISVLFMVYLFMIINDVKDTPIPPYIGFYIFCISIALAVLKLYRKSGEVVKIVNDSFLFLAAAFASMKMLYIINPLDTISEYELQTNIVPFTLRLTIIVCSFAKAFISASDLRGKPITNKK